MDAVASIYDRTQPDGRATSYSDWVLDAEAFALLVWHNPDIASWLFLFYSADTRDGLLEQARATASRLDELDLERERERRFEGEGEGEGAATDSFCDRVESAFAELDRQICDRLLCFLNS